MVNKDLIGKTLTKGNFTGKVIHITDSQITMVNEHGCEKTFDIKKKPVKDSKENKQAVKDAEFTLFPYLLLKLDNEEDLIEDSAITDMPQPTPGYSSEDVVYLKDPRTGETKRIYPDYSYFYYVRPNDDKEIIIPLPQKANGKESFSSAVARAEMGKLIDKDIEEGLYPKEEKKNITLQFHYKYENYNYAKENYRRFVIIKPGDANNPSKDKYVAFVLKEFDQDRSLPSYYLTASMSQDRVWCLGLYNTFEDAQKAVDRYFELDYDYSTFKQEYSSNIEEYELVKGKNQQIKGEKSGETKTEHKQESNRGDTGKSGVVNFQPNTIFTVKRANYNLPISKSRNAMDYLKIGGSRINLFSIAKKEYLDEINSGEITETTLIDLFKPARLEEVNNKILNSRNVLEAFYIIRDFWKKEAEELDLDLSELDCVIGGSEGNGTGTIDIRLKELGYQDTGNGKYYNPETGDLHPKSIKWYFGESVPQELVDMFS